MNGLGLLAQQPVIYSLGWTLIHFVWQGALLGGACALALHLLRERSANLRYAVGVATLLLMAITPFVTLLIVHGGQPFVLANSDAAVPAWSYAVATAGGGESGLAVAFAAALPWLVVAWFAGVLALAVRLCAGWWRIQKLRSVGIAPAPDWVQRIVGTLAVELHVPVRVQVLLSTMIDVPTVIGWLRPVILLPAAVVTGLSPQQLEMVIAHELGHVRRFDYLINLVQVMIGTLLFYHPAVRWVSERVRIERENCCDDIVIAHTTDPVAYARALAALEAERRPSVGLAMAATGGSLLDRIHRLFGQPTTQYGRARVGWIAAIGAVVVITTTIAATRPWWGDDAVHVDDSDTVASTEVRADPVSVDEHPDVAVAARPDVRTVLVDDAAPAMPELSDRGLNDDMQRATDSIAAPAQMPKPEIRVAARLAPLPQPSVPDAVETRAEPAAAEPRAEPETKPVEGTPRRGEPPVPAPTDTAATSSSAPRTGGVELVVRRLPEALHSPRPEYPTTEWRRGIAGAVTASFVILPDGSVDEIEILGSVGGAAFDREVARALAEWKFAPPGADDAVEATRLFRFEPDDDQVAARECAVTGSRLCRQARSRIPATQRHNVRVLHFHTQAGASLPRS